MAIAADSVAAGLPAWCVRRVTEHIEQNLDKPLALTELAAVVYMSRFHFARLFQRSTGDPPHRFVIRQRIARACEFLARSELTIAEISRRVGFRTPSHFRDEGADGVDVGYSKQSRKGEFSWRTLTNTGRMF